MLLWSNLRAVNFIILDTLLDLVNQGLIYTDLLFVCQAQTLIYQRGKRGVLKVKMAVVNPETASVTTTRDSSLKI